MGISDHESIEFSQDIRKLHDHIVDSTNLLIFIFLLILVVLTIWLFKHKRFPYLHETGLAIIYGSLFGIIIRYGFTRTNKKSLNLVANLTLSDIRDLPEFIYLGIPNNTQQKFVYTYKHPKRSNEINTQDFEEKATFDPEIFFNLLLPPIIFHAGYSMKKKHFFKNFGAILMFAIVGTTISCFMTGGLMYICISIFRSIKDYFSFTDCLFFGAIISATDPVTVLAIFNDHKINVNLHALVFGESVLNDAVSITLAQAIEKYSGATGFKNNFDINQFFNCFYNLVGVFFASFAIGSAMGCFTALLTKFTYIRQHPSLETALFILMSYSTFLASEAMGFTGIISVLFNGIVQAHYTFNNLSKESQTNTKQVFDLLNFLSENFIFIYIGITVFTYRNHQWEVSFIICSLIAILIARAVNIYPLAFLINLSRSADKKIDLNMQHFLFFSGLRGAMAFALAIRNTSTQARRLILSTTLVIVILTVILCGGLTNKMLEWLKLLKPKNPDENEMAEILKDEYDEDSNDGRDKNKIKKLIKKFSIFRGWHLIDQKFMKPLFTNHVPALTNTLPNFCMPLSKLLTTKEQIESNNEIPFSKLDNSNLMQQMNSNNSIVNKFERSELHLNFDPLLA